MLNKLNKLNILNKLNKLNMLNMLNILNKLNILNILNISHILNMFYIFDVFDMLNLFDIFDICDIDRHPRDMIGIHCSFRTIVTSSAPKFSTPLKISKDFATRSWYSFKLRFLIIVKEVLVILIICITPGVSNI